MNPDVRTLSRNGQVSIPVSARKRWRTTRLLVVDLGDRVVIRPASDDPAEELMGKYAHLGLSSDEMRRRDREDEREARVDHRPRRG